MQYICGHAVVINAIETELYFLQDKQWKPPFIKGKLAGKKPTALSPRNRET
jgi:hypothetical protein